MGRLRAAVVLPVVFALFGCAVGPNYKRPNVDVPPTYRGAAANHTAASDAASLGDEKWWAVFQDEALQGLIRTALQKNYDLRIPPPRAGRAQAPLRNTRAGHILP